MADIQKTIEIIFAGTNKIGGTIDAVGKDLNSLSSSITSTTQPLADLTGSLLKTEAAILATGAAMVGVSINEAGKFSTTLTEIGTLFNGTSEDVAGLSDEIIAYSRSSTASIDEITGSVYQAISTGTDFKNSVELVAEAEKLATAGRADLQAVTELLTGSMNAYGVSVGEAGDFSDVLFTAVQQGKTSIPELAAEMTKVSSIAAAAQVPFDDLGAALSALTIYSGSTNKAATQLKTLLAELLDPSEELKDALGTVSLETDGLGGVMERLQVVTGGNAEKFVTLFGSINATQAAIALSNDSAGTFNNSLEAMETRAGRVAAANEVMSGTFESINQNLLNNIKATLIEFGGPLLDEYQANAEALANIFAGVAIEFDNGAFAPIYEALETFGRDSAEFLQGVADALPEAFANIDTSGVLDALFNLRDGFGELFGGLDLTKADDLEKALQFLVNGFEKLTDITAKIIESFGPLVTYLGDMADQFLATDTNVEESLGTFLGFATQVNLLAPAIGGVGTALSSLGEIVVTIAGVKYLGGLSTILGGIVSTLTGPVGLVTAVGLAGTALGVWAADVAELSDKIDANKTSYDNWNRAFEESENGWEGAINNLVRYGESIDHLNDALVEQFGVTAEQVKQFGSIENAQIAATVSSEGYVESIFEGIRAEKEAAITRGEVSDGYDELVRQKLRASEGSLDELATNEQLIAAYQNMSAEQYASLDAEEQLRIQRAFGVEVIGEVKDKTEELTEEQRKAKLSAKELSEEYLKELEILKEFELGLETLASNERIRNLELNFDLKLEQLKADSERAQAIIDSIGTTVTSTGELLGSLFSVLGDADFFDRQEILAQIDLENERRQQALDMQQELTEKQIELMDAQIQNLESGEALINIQADGLEPEIRAFMYRILDNIRVEMSRDQLAFITGVNG